MPITRKSINLISVARHVAKVIWTCSKDEEDPLYDLGLRSVVIEGDTLLSDEDVEEAMPMVIIDCSGGEGEVGYDTASKTHRCEVVFRIMFMRRRSDLEEQGLNLMVALTHLYDLFNQGFANNGNKRLIGWGLAETQANGVAVSDSGPTDFQLVDPFEVSEDGSLDAGYVDLKVELEVFL